MSPPPLASSHNENETSEENRVDIMDYRLLGDEAERGDDEMSSTAGDEVPHPLFEMVLNRILCRSDIEEEKLESKPASYLELFRFTSKRDRVFLLIACILALIEGALRPVILLIVGEILNIYISTKDPVGNDEFFSKIIELMYFNFFMTFVIFVISFIESFMLRSITFRIIDNLRREFLHAVLMQDAAWHDKHAAGALTNSNIERIKDALGDKIGMLARGLATLVSSAVIGFFLHAKLSAAMALMAPLSALMMGVAPRFTAKPTKTSMALFEDANPRRPSRSSGRQTLDDYLLGSLSLYHLRNSLSLVGQEPVLFRGSIADNIRLGVEGEVSDEQIREAAKAAAAAGFIEALPELYDTSIGDSGRLLSGGQRQRIAIARALARQPKVLLLDEATAALDAAAEQSVRRALESSSVGRTTITIAHRLASIENVHTIHYIEDGRIVESGSHQELLRRRGKYAALAAQQSLA